MKKLLIIDARDDSQVLLDVRNPGELLKAGSIAGAINIPLDQLRERLNELPEIGKYWFSVRWDYEGM